MLTETQKQELSKPLDPRRVSKDNKGFSHLEAWDVRRRLTEIFGFGGWSSEIRSCELVSEQLGPYKKKVNGREVEAQGWTVVYRVHASLVIGNSIYEDVAVGGAVNQPSRVDAHDNACKTAASGALKRCAVNLGDQFGLSLYDNGSTKPVVHVVSDQLAADVSAAREAEIPSSSASSLEQLLMSIGSVATVEDLKELWLKTEKNRSSYSEAHWQSFQKAVRARKEQLLKVQPDPPASDQQMETLLQKAGMEYTKVE